MLPAVYIAQLCAGFVCFWWFFVINFNYSSTTAEWKVAAAVPFICHFTLSAFEAFHTRRRLPTFGAAFLVPFVLWLLFVLSASPWSDSQWWLYATAGLMGAGGVAAFGGRMARREVDADDQGTS